MYYIIGGLGVARPTRGATRHPELRRRAPRNDVQCRAGSGEQDERERVACEPAPGSVPLFLGGAFVVGAHAAQREEAPEDGEAVAAARAVAGAAADARDGRRLVRTYIRVCMCTCGVCDGMYTKCTYHIYMYVRSI